MKLAVIAIGVLVTLVATVNPGMTQQTPTISGLLQQGYEVVGFDAGAGTVAIVLLKKGTSLYVCVGSAPNGIVSTPYQTTEGCSALQ
jgi:hypothetical protein